MIENCPDIWLPALPQPNATSHKYNRGQAVILAASDMVGATILAATACARIGAGIVRVLVMGEPAQRHLQTFIPPHIIVTTDKTVLHDPLTRVVLAGCGLTGREPILQGFFEICPKSSLILDGGALRFIAAEKKYDLLTGTIITPHDGEYEDLFGNVENRTQQDYSQDYDCIIARKGAETVITTPDELGVVNRHASPWLATAGTGDVLAGMIAGLLAQGMASSYACAAAIWIHGEAGRRIGPGLVASDIPHIIPVILDDLFQNKARNA